MASEQERKEAFLKVWFDAPENIHWAHGMSNGVEKDISDTFDRAIAAWNTRPAPAATDTGLETVAWNCTYPSYGHFTLKEHEAKQAIEEGAAVKALCYCSQAVELLAGRDTVIEMQADSIDKLERKVQHWQDKHATLEADNAALAARIKDLGDYAREATKAITGLTGGGSENFGKEIGDVFTADLPYCVERIRERYVSKVEVKRLEAKLAAAQKVLEQLRSDCQSPIDMYERNGPEFTSPQGNEYESTSCVMAKFAELVASIDAARAVLGGKPT